MAAAGTVVAIDQTVTTQSEGGVAGETLGGLIRVDADIVSGDSGGPLRDADGEVVGIDTAASSGSAGITGYAIPISTALDIVAQIEAGVETESIEIGSPAFLGVGLSSTSATATIVGVYDGTPAAEAGLTEGDTITAVNAAAVATGSALSELLASMAPGDTVTLSWTTAAGESRTAEATLIAGPAV